MDRASQALAQGLPPSVRRTWAALSDVSDVRLATLWHRAHGRRSIEEKAVFRYAGRDVTIYTGWRRK